MKSAPFEYQRPDTLGDAIEMLSDDNSFTKILAGGQTLGPMMNLRLVQVDRLVDISQMPVLKETSENHSELVVGGAVRHADIEDGRVPDVTKGMMARVASSIAYRAVRNRGTLGGSLAHSEPAADWPNLMMALEAKVTITGPDGDRLEPFADFHLGALSTNLAENEILKSVHIPAFSNSATWGYYKDCRKVGEFAHSISAVVLDQKKDVSRVTIGGPDVTPRRLANCETFLSKLENWTPSTPDGLLEAFQEDILQGAISLDDFGVSLHGYSLQTAAQEALQK